MRRFPFMEGKLARARRTVKGRVRTGSTSGGPGGTFILSPEIIMHPAPTPSPITTSGEPVHVAVVTRSGDDFGSAQHALFRLVTRREEKGATGWLMEGGPAR